MLSEGNSHEWIFNVVDNYKVKTIVGQSDANGFRPTLYNSHQNVKTVLVVGDSMTFCAEAPDAETWCELLAKEMHKKNIEIKVKNVSSRGWSAVQCLLAMKKYLHSIDNVSAVIYFSCPNDAIESFSELYGFPVPMIDFKNGQFNISNFDAERGLKLTKKNDKFFRFQMLRTNSALFNLAAGGNSKDFTLHEPISEEDYLQFWGGRARPVFNNANDIFTFLLESDEARESFKGMKYIVKEMKEVCDSVGVKLVIANAPWGPYYSGSDYADFKDLLHLTEDEYHFGKNSNKQYGRAMNKICQQLNVDCLTFKDDIFSGFGYRGYAAAPSDWHYSIESGKRISLTLSEVLQPILLGAVSENGK